MNKINIGDITLEKVKLGTDDVFIYLGTELVYSSHNYPAQYLTFRALEDGTFKFTGSGMSYSLDEGQTWTSIAADANTPIVSSGSTIMWKANLSPAGYLHTEPGELPEYIAFKFSSTGQFEAEGNIMSIASGDSFASATTVVENQFHNLFESCTGLTNTENLVLPSTTLSNECYEGMFRDCTNLTNAPELPAATLASLCNNSMFFGCSSLSAITCLATDISATDCTYNWVNGVASTGTFVKAGNMTGWTTGWDGIPSGWTVSDYPTQSRTISGSPYCSGSTGTDKYIDVYSQVSYDGKRTWVTTATTPTIIEEHSADCGFAERTLSGTPYCSGTSMVVDETYQQSYDSGSTWTTISSSTTVVKRCSSDCGCEGCVEKFCGVDTGGTDFVIYENGSSTLTQTEFTNTDIASGTVGSSVTIIGPYCFQDIANTVSSITIGDTVQEINHEAFMQTQYLTTLTIPASVTQIDFWAFTRCYGLQEAIFEGTTPPSFATNLTGIFHDYCPPVIYVPDSAVSAYRAIPGDLWTSEVWSETIIQPISNRPIPNS